MKSPMVTHASWLPEKEGYSDLQVLKSGAGWYVGTIYTGPDGFLEPGSRDTDYFATEAEAAEYLKQLEAMGEDMAAVVCRMTP